MLSLGIDVGGTTIKAGLVTAQGEIIAEQVKKTIVDKGVETIINTITSLAKELIQEKDISLSDLQGVGVGIPGYINYDEGRVILAPNLKWRDVPFKKLLEQEFKVPVFLDNDVNAAALGEQYFGAGKGIDDFVMLTVGTGLGGALVLKGEVYRGTLGLAGEVGHMVVQDNGLLCGCGQRGCLETLTSASAIIKQAREAGLKVTKAKEVFNLAHEGEVKAQKIVQVSAYYLGLGISNLVNLLNPQRVIIGGGVSKAGDILFKPVSQTVERLCLNTIGSQVEIISAKLGNKAGIIGAGTLPR